METFSSISELSRHPPPDIVLGCGSPAFLREHVASLPGLPIIVLVTGGCQLGRGPRRIDLGSDWKWRRVSHANLGGVTTGSYLVGARTLVLPPPPFSSLKRTIRHVLDYGVRGGVARDDRDQRFYTELHLLSPGNLTMSVCFPSSFSATGFCARRLTPKELGLAFDLPSGVLEVLDESLIPLTFPLIPGKVSGAIWKGYLVSTAASPVLSAMTTAPLVIPTGWSLKVPDAHTWLPTLNQRLPHSWIDPTLITENSVKADKDGVPSHLWDLRVSLIFPHIHPLVLSVLRRYMVRRWRFNLLHSFRHYMAKNYGNDWSDRLRSARRTAAGLRPLKRHRGGDQNQPQPPQTVLEQGSVNDSRLRRDAEAGASVLHQNCSASWWDWSGGSALVFWRWPSHNLLQEARDGTPFFVRGHLPNNRRPQRAPPAQLLPLVAEKIANVRTRGYIIPGRVKSLTAYFQVPKGTSDLRIVYDGTSSGLNDSLWAPSFWMPTPDTAMRQISFYSFCVDIDLGEMFLNFPMDAAIQPYAGIDLSPLTRELGKLGTTPAMPWEKWTRLFMGCKLCPYLSIRYTYHAEEFVVGDRRLADNPLRWDDVVLNLPGDCTFDPRLPWVYRRDSCVDKIAASICAFVDDFRITGHSVENSWQAARQVAARLQYLGLQDAPRKRRPPSQEPGAWAGCVFRISPDHVGKTVTREKWEKGKTLVNELFNKFGDANDRPILKYKDLERKRGFLGHLCMTYKFLVPFMKGLHLTIDSWRPMRDPDGWKLSRDEWESYLQCKGLNSPDDSPHPESVQAASRLYNDLRAFKNFFSHSEPPEVQMRVSKMLAVVYGFGDASGSGFGSSFKLKKGISYRIGVYGSDIEGESSNYRELSNVLDALEEESASGSLGHSVVFFFTDNSTVESALYKGSSSSKKLLDLVIKFYTLQARYGIQIHVIHVSGKRMIAQGTDGLSRGQLDEGVMSGTDMLEFVPLHLTALQRSPTLKNWITSWAGSALETLTSSGWFERGHDITGGAVGHDSFWRPTITSGIYLWAPPPAAADVALEQLRIARIKRQASTHIFVCPRLMTPLWLKQLYKAADLIFTVQAGISYWPNEMLEPLLIGVVFPFLSFAPWQLKGTPKLLSLGRQLSRVRKGEHLDAGPILREFFELRKRMESMPRDVVRKLLHYRPRT